LREFDVEQISKIASFDDHKRYVLYPERYFWATVREGVYDAMLDDFHQNYDLRRNLLQNEYDSIGIACSCHPTLQQFCIIELGLNV